MKKCKWAGDKSDNYCVSCDGINMMVEGVQTSCTKCAGYEPGEEIPVMNEPVNTDIPFEETKQEPTPVPTPVEVPVTSKTKSVNKKTAANKKANTADTNKVKTEGTVEENVNDKIVEKVQEQKEESDGIKIVSLNYTSGCTVKHDDTYYKFVAEEKWDLTNFNGDVQEARDMLWAQLNTEIDNQIADIIK